MSERPPSGQSVRQAGPSGDEYHGISGGWLRLKQTDLIPVRGSSASVSIIRSATVVRQRFFGIPAPTPTSSQRNTSGRAGWKRLGPVVTMRSRSLGRQLSECWL